MEQINNFSLQKKFFLFIDHIAFFKNIFELTIAVKFRNIFRWRVIYNS